LLFPREEKKAFRAGSVGTTGANKTKAAKALEASDLRAFNKVYIIGN
jgi:hypothetical protein